MKKLFALFVGIFLAVNTVLAQDVWVNDLRNLFLSNQAIIYGINLRTFAAVDTDKNGIIDNDEERGNFLNAVGRLDELQSLGINTIHVLPIMQIGKVHALGTAGSLYAMSSFTTLNPQLKSERSALSIEDQARKFISEAHKRNIRVIIDLPSCGSYDLYLSHPELFLTDASGNPVIPLDWTDVRVFNSGNENQINVNLLNLHKGFVDYVIRLGADGIRADVASLKPAKFWQELITYSRQQDPQFLWLAESSDSWTQPVATGAPYTSYDKLLQAGFDGFYGSFFNLKNWNTASELMNHINFINSLKFSEKKSVIGSFTTHDEMSPILINGPIMSNMITWLNATLPINAYYIDGFETGDNYIYLWANKKAFKTYTDNDTYFVHRGKIDIFNFSRRPGGFIRELRTQVIQANAFKNYISPFVANGKFTELKTNDKRVFAYAQSCGTFTVLVFGNISFKDFVEAKIKVPGYNPEMLTIPIKIDNAATVNKNHFETKFDPGEIQVYLIDKFDLK